MGIQVNGQSCVPPGFRFHPTEEELLNYYLKKKVACEKIDLDVIRDIDLNKLEPWDIQDKCRIGSAPQNEWYFFSHKDKKYPTGTRTNRATAAGFWKATGRDKVIHSSFKRIGKRKTLVFYKGRAPHGLKSDWIMHEYRLDDHFDTNNSSSNASCLAAEAVTTQEEGWVVCRVFKKKNYPTLLTNPRSNSSIISNARTQMLHSFNDEPLDQIFHYLGRSCKQESDAIVSMDSMNKKHYLRPIETALSNMNLPLPTLENPILQSLPSFVPEVDPDENNEATMDIELVCNSMPALNDWPSMDDENSSHLGSGYLEVQKQTPYNNEPSFGFLPSSGFFSNLQDCRCGDGDPWILMQSVSSCSDHI